MKTKGLVLLLFTLLSIASASLHALEHLHEAETSLSQNNTQDCSYCANLSLDDALPEVFIGKTTLYYSLVEFVAHPTTDTTKVSLILKPQRGPPALG